MPFIASKVLTPSSIASKTNSPSGILPGLMRADILRRVGFYGTLCGVILSALIYCGSTTPVLAEGPARRVGLPWDWSHEHVVFGKTDDPAVRAIIKKDPRAYHQWLRRNRTTVQGTVEGAPISRASKQRGKRDWGKSLGATQFNAVNSTAAPLYAAKYNFDLSAIPDCVNDYAAFPTGALGATSTTMSGQASIAAFNNLYASQGGSGGGLCGNAGPSVDWAYINANCPATTSTDPILSSPVISLDGTKVAWVTTTGKVQIVTWGAGTTTLGGAESVVNPACIGSAIAGGDGASMQSVTLANATRVGPSVTTSEIFVDYGADAAYVGDDDGFLHKISPFFNASGTLQEVTASVWQASQAYGLGDVIIDTNGFIEECTKAGTSGSSQPGWSTFWGSTIPFDGGALGVTWTNIGSGGGWPIYVTGSTGHLDHSKLNAPVPDVVSRNIIVGDGNGSLYYVLNPGMSAAVGSCASGVSLYPCLGLPGTATPITAAAGAQAHCSSAFPGPTCLVMSNQQGFTDGVIVDISNNLVITQFSNADGTNAAVEQTDSSLSVFHSATLAGEVNGLAHHTGVFDNANYTAPATGYYYVCGPAADGIETDLYRVSFTNSGTVVLGSVNGTPVKLSSNGNSANCSPLTEIYNAINTPVHDWLFLSLDNHGYGPNCADGSCVVEFDLGSTTVGNPMVTGGHAGYGAGTGGIAGMKGTGGIIVDNEVAVGNTDPSQVTAASESGTTATITTSATLGVEVGQNIHVAGMQAGLTGYNTVAAAVTCVGASCGPGATASSISYTASPGLSSCSSAGTCSGSAFGIGFPQASSIYFMPVSNTLTCGDGTSGTGCAVKLTQAGLN